MARVGRRGEPRQDLLASALGRRSAAWAERRPLPAPGAGHGERALFTRAPGLNCEGKAQTPWTDELAITELGYAVLRGEVNFRSLDPAPRWVGGVEIAAGEVDWHWDDQRRDAVRR
jgi:hypothetical protein